MIDYLVGKVKDIKDNKVTVLINGLGLSVSTPNATQIKLNDNVELYSYMHWNAENGPSLFGFKEELDRTVFLIIISCSKIGPKIALNVLNQMSASEFLEIISSQNEKALSRINGIGPKSAENIVTQLKHKVSKLISEGNIKPSSSLSHFQTLNDALLTLGYTRQEITKVLQDQSLQDQSLQDRSLQGGSNNGFDQLLRRALSILSKSI